VLQPSHIKRRVHLSRLWTPCGKSGRKNIKKNMPNGPGVIMPPCAGATRTDMQQVIIMRGISGSGKSTLTRKILTDLPRKQSSLIVSADHFFLDPEGNYKFNPALLGNAHLDCERRFLEGCQAGIDTIIVDNTNMKLWEMAPYRTIGMLYGYFIRYISLTCDPQIAQERNKHGVPLHVIQNQVKNFEPVPKSWGTEEKVSSER
jgi:predicted kinase